MNDDEDRWRRAEPPARGPSAPPSLKFDPLSTGIGVFIAVAIPIVVVGFTRSGGANYVIVALGVVIGFVAGVIAGVWVASRDGQVWRGRF